MTDAAARPAEFGTGLRARIESGPACDDPRPSPSSRDLLLLAEPDPAEPATHGHALVSRDLAVRGAWGAFSA